MSGAPTAAYQPGSGLEGKLRRGWARVAGRAPARVRTDIAVVSVTFDDIPKSASQAGADALNRVEARGTFYIASGYAGTSNHLGALFDPVDVERLLADGHEIGCHTYTHRDCARTAVPEIQDEIARNAVALTDMGVPDPVSFAFPYGEARPAAKRVLSETFSTLRGVRPGGMRGPIDRALLPATAIDGGPEGVARAEAAVRQVCEAGGWLVLFTHDVRDEPSPWGCTPEQLADVLNTAKAGGAQFLPVGDTAPLVFEDTP